MASMLDHVVPQGLCVVLLLISPRMETAQTRWVFVVMFDYPHCEEFFPYV